MKAILAAIALTVAFTASAQTNITATATNKPAARKAAAKAAQKAKDEKTIADLDHQIAAWDKEAERRRSMHLSAAEIKKAETRANDLREQRRNLTKVPEKNHPIIINFGRPSHGPEHAGVFIGQGGQGN